MHRRLVLLPLITFAAFSALWLFEMSAAGQNVDWVKFEDASEHAFTTDVPKGWTIIHTSDNHGACLAFVGQHWTDIRPNSLIKRMKQSG